MVTRLAGIFLGLLFTSVRTGFAFEAVADEGDPQSILTVFGRAGFDQEAWDELATGDSQDEANRELLTRLAYRIEQIPPGTLARWVESSIERTETGFDTKGQWVRLKGRIVRRISIDGDLDPAATETVPSPVVCLGKSDDSSQAVAILSNRIPQEWEEQQSLNERFSCIAVTVGRWQMAEGQDVPLLATKAIQWFPDETGLVATNGGTKILADLGVDAGLFDSIRHRQPLLALESPAFYSVLRAVSSVGARQLGRMAHANLADFAETYEDGNVERAEASALSRQQQAILADTIRTRASEGMFSVAPFFLDYRHLEGELTVVEGVCRRALKINSPPMEPKSDMAGPATVVPLDHYYELELFTADSQNEPLVWCVVQLPQGFPTGDAIEEPVRIAGFFFKKWRYRSRRIAMSPSSNAFENHEAPLFLGNAPEWLLSQEEPAFHWGVWLGPAFALVLGCICWHLYTVNRRDQAIRERIRRRHEEWDASHLN